MASGEESLHRFFQEAFRPSRGLSGPGDDCARVEPPSGWRLVLTTDQVVEGVHAAPGTPPARLAGKLLRRTLSDLAAAGASPWAVSWTVTVPPERSPNWLRSLVRAFVREAGLFGAAVVGGDLSTGPAVVLGCTALGRQGRRRPPGRGGARPGQWLCVTGRLGGAVRSGRHLHPEPRLTEGRLLVERYRAAAMMDLSDGLARDLPRLLAASEVGAVVELDALPLTQGLQHDPQGWSAAVGEGEDYELLVALEPDLARRAIHDPVLRRTGFHVIGEVVAGSRLRWQVDGRDRELDLAPGWEHRWGGARDGRR